MPTATNPDVSPIYGDLRDLPPVLLVVGTLDILLEDNQAMAALLSAARGEVDLRVYPECPHGFTSFPTAMASTALNDIECWLAHRLLDTHSAPEPGGIHTRTTMTGDGAGGWPRTELATELPAASGTRASTIAGLCSRIATHPLTATSAHVARRRRIGPPLPGR